LRHLPKSTPNPNLLVGLDTSDDAGVFQLTEDLALVQTVDYFTPIVDDPYMFGQIAAANALSDIYAMGGKPITALNIVGFPINKLDKQILAEILRGAGDKLEEAGATLVGGHSIDDTEPKFGMAVTGLIHPKRILTNCSACPGDLLILTKPIGVGILTTAIKRDKLDEESIKQVVQVMATLNKTAAEVAERYEVHAATDVTGFGLLGHASEMARGSNVGLEIELSKVPILPRTREMALEKAIPGGTKSNHRWLQDKVEYDAEIDEIDQYILCDAVTSGGLLFSVAPDDAEEMVRDLQARGVQGVIIGRVVADHPGIIRVRK
jgi:selenide,water dikinase